MNHRDKKPSADGGIVGYNRKFLDSYRPNKSRNIAVTAAGFLRRRVNMLPRRRKSKDCRACALKQAWNKFETALEQDLDTLQQDACCNVCVAGYLLRRKWK